MPPAPFRTVLRRRRSWAVGLGLGAVVDADGGGDFSTLQAAIDSGTAHIYVLKGTYNETLTGNTHTAQILDFNPGVFITGAGPHTFNADYTEFRGDPDFTGNVDIGGDGQRYLGMNNIQFQNGLDFTGAAPMLDGGGFNSLVDGAAVANQHGISMAESDGIFTALSANTDTGAGAKQPIIVLDATDVRNVVTSVSIPNGDNNGMSILGNDSLVGLAYITAATTRGISIGNGARSIAVASNNSSNGTNTGFEIDQDDAICAFNISDNPSGAAFLIEDPDIVTYANRSNGAIDYTGGTGLDVQSGNNETAF